MPYGAKKHNSLLIVTFDEDDYVTKNGNQIPTIFYGAKLIPGTYKEQINHYNIFHTLESMYGLPVTDQCSRAACRKYLGQIKALVIEKILWACPYLFFK